MSPHDPKQTLDHGRQKQADAKDPMRLEGAWVEGDPRAMLEGMVEEYARMGMDCEQIHSLFDDPNYRATHGLLVALGAEEVHKRVDEVLARNGVWRVSISETTLCMDDCSSRDTAGGVHND
ncbi:hypothetical protein CMO84_08825 [Candidatus Woesearchaeota archaeon]|jgi:hypothetical protein|nr:hypothetical protein [Candidatus Woesearchaeota archaeon]MDP6740698.1 hypothetical protein [Planctomycetota bacterium]